MNVEAVEIRDRIERAARTLGRPITLMEICGTHTMAIFRHGIRPLLPKSVRLISGPGCPVCVTSQGYIDAVVELAGRDGLTIATYGDMIRVPGRHGSLEQARADGARVVPVFSAMDAVDMARDNPRETVAFVAVGFETTAPATAAAVRTARAERLENFVVLTAHKFVLPAMRALLDSGQINVDGFLCPGHVSVILGAKAYESVAHEYNRPCAIAGFEPMQMLTAIALLLEMLAANRGEVLNVYKGVVTPDGNVHARALLAEVFQPADARWRGIGVIPDSGMELRDEFAAFDGFRRFASPPAGDNGGRLGALDDDPPGCSCGQVVRGLIDPPACPLFGKSCTTANPIGPCMVSSEGTCAAWFKYGNTGIRQQAAGRADSLQRNE